MIKHSFLKGKKLFTVLDKCANKNYCIIAVFLIGNLIIRFPKGEGQQHSFMGFLLCFLITAILFVFIEKYQFSNPVFLKMFDNNIKLSLYFKLLFLIFAVICFVITVKDYCLMLKQIRLQNTSNWILTVVYLAIILLLSLCKEQVILYFSFVNLILIFIGIFFMFTLSAKAFDITFLKDALTFEYKNALTQGLTFFIHGFGQVYLCSIFLAKNKKPNQKSGAILGVGLGGILLLICFLNVILMVSSEIIVRLDFPYASVTAMLISGDGYNRLDSITYYVYFICNILKSAVLLKLINNLTLKKRIRIYLTAITLVLAFMFATFNGLGILLQTKTMNFILLCIEVLAPISVGIWLLVNKTKQRFG